jgi:hypothetical protein
MGIELALATMRAQYGTGRLGWAWKVLVLENITTEIMCTVDGEKKTALLSGMHLTNTSISSELYTSIVYLIRSNSSLANSSSRSATLLTKLTGLSMPLSLVSRPSASTAFSPIPLSTLIELSSDSA